MFNLKIIILFFLICILTYSAKTDLILELNYDNEYKFYDKINPIFQHKTDIFDLYIDVEFYNNDKYSFNEDKFYAGHYFIMKNGYTDIRLNKNLNFKLGRMEQKDEIESPYTLFFSSENHSALSYELKYEDERFFYKSRWIALNSELSEFKDENDEVIERGANYKAFGFKFGKYRFVYQDIVVYKDRYFDMDYFANPIPAYFSQEGTHSMNSPWNQNTNENSIMGFLLDRKGDENYCSIQVLIDDFNANRIFDKGGKQNPDKIAFSLSYESEKEYGYLKLHLAGATKYTFEPMGSKNTNQRYGYTYYPDTVYNGNKEISYIDNYIGYKYGENTLSMMTELKKDKINYFVELIFSGDKSPVNPWHEYEEWEEGGSGFKYLDGKLEKTVKIGLDYRTEKYYISGYLGKVWNKLKLEDLGIEEDGGINDMQIFKASNESENLISFKFGKVFNIF